MTTREELRKEFNISSATLNNWYRTGTIEAPSNGTYYTEQEYFKVKNNIISNSDKLKGRANRLHMDDSYICYLGISDDNRKRLLERAVEIHETCKLKIEDSVLLLCIQILKSTKLISDSSLSAPKSKLDVFIINWASKVGVKDIFSNIFNELEYRHIDDDFIGAFYQSITSISQKSKLGAYFTPSNLLEGISFDPNSTVLDPCCGSGGILIRVLNKNHDQMKVYANDIDEIALQICTVNLSLFFMTNDIKFNVGFKDILTAKKSSEISLFDISDNNIFFDYIITNPPWGSKLDFKKKEALIKKYDEISTSESFSVALFNCINSLNSKGTLIFFLPHSILNVGTHKNIRKFLLSKNRAIKIDLLGNAFHGVVSEAIRLTFCNEKHSNSIEIINNEQEYQLNYKEILPPDYIVQATANSFEKDILSHVFTSEHITLKNNADFALGIVTGNNAKHISKIKNNENMEPIYKGKDIEPFGFLPAECFIEFHPEQYQQIASVDKYRQPKISYRFINDRIVCAFDSQGRLLLNSANLFIPKIDYPIETIVCLFNSKLYSFIYRKMFHSKKVLRSHIESLPLPIIDENLHRAFKDTYNLCINSSINMSTLDKLVYNIFNISNEQIETIEKEF